MGITLVMDTTVYGHEIGQKIEVAADIEGTPLDQMWRRRLADSGGVCHVEEASQKTKTKTKTKEI